MKELISVNGQTYPWKSREMYARLMGCYPDETGFRHNSNRSQKILAILHNASPDLARHEVLGINLFGADDQNARNAIWTEVDRMIKVLKASRLYEQIAIYSVTGQGYLLSPKLPEKGIITLPDGQQLFVQGDRLVQKLK